MHLGKSKLFLAQCDNQCGVFTNGTVEMNVHLSDEETFTRQVPSPKQATVLLIMNNLKATDGNFTFETKYYVPYGHFITEIMQVKPADKQYWALSVNGVFAKCGVDTFILEEGDVIDWKLASWD